MAAADTLSPLIVPYDSTVFAGIGSLEDAHEATNANPAFSGFLSEFAKLAVESAQNDIFGLTLVHRHTNVRPGERMLDLNQTLQPLPLADDAFFALVSRIWMPYEFELGGSENIASTTSFFDDIKRRIEELGLSHIGLRRYSPDDPEELEVTEHGGVSVKIPWKFVNDKSSLKYRTTFWVHPSGEPKTYRCACTDTGSADLPNHNHINQN